MINYYIAQMKRIIQLLLVFYLAFYGSLASAELTKEDMRKLRLAEKAEPNALQIVKIYAESGNADAQEILGGSYYSYGVMKNAAKAEEWRRKAALQGHDQALFYLSLDSKYENNNIKEAAEWDRKRLDFQMKRVGQGDALEQARTLSTIGSIYALSTLKDDAQAASWNRKALDAFTKLAAQDNADAQLTLVVTYSYGITGVNKDSNQVNQWLEKTLISYKKLAMQGDLSAIRTMINFYTEGRFGITKDDSKVADWKTKLVEATIKLTEKTKIQAENGDLNAQSKLGLTYAIGDEGVKKDEIQAVYWYNKAANQGDLDAGKIAGYLEDKLAKEGKLKADVMREAEVKQKKEKDKIGELKVAEKKSAEESQAFKQSLNKMNAGQLFAKADELNSQGDKAKAREALRALVSRFPNHALAGPASQQLASMSSADANTPVSSSTTTSQVTEATNSDVTDATQDESVDGTFTSLKKAGKNKKRK